MVCIHLARPSRRFSLFRPGIVLCLAVLISLGVSSCLSSPGSKRDYRPGNVVSLCHRYLLTLNETIRQAGSQDVQYTLLPDYPHLRVDRFLASLLPDISKPSEYHLWLDLASSLATESFEVELANLRPAPGASTFSNNDNDLAKTRLCIRTLTDHEKYSPSPTPRIRSQAVVDDSYIPWQRVVGIYPLVLLPTAWGIYKHEKEISEEHKHLAKHGLVQAPDSLFVYRPATKTGDGEIHPATLLKRTSQNPLGIPMLNNLEKQRLFDFYAPVWVVTSHGSADRLGTVSWSADGYTPVVTIDKATSYNRISFSRYRKKILLQLNYVIWFPERPRSSILDLLGGHMDGITWRVTLDSRGQILMQDTIHNCGCYHMFYPGIQLEQKPVEASLAESAFVPDRTVSLKQGERFRIYVTHGSHYITGLGIESSGPQPKGKKTGTPGKLVEKTYRSESYNTLRRLPLPSTGTRSLFDTSGLVPGSERAERYLFWPLGVVSAGAMRQWGHHATAFIGRRHFDDPDLIEKNFLMKSAQ